jgi:hypothetical protein
VKKGTVELTLRQQTFWREMSVWPGKWLGTHISGRSIREGVKARAAMDVYAESST